MGNSFRFIAAPSETSEVLAWFESLPLPPDAISTDYGYVLYFRECGPLRYQTDGRIDAQASPVATVFLPKTRRQLLWTVGEVHFLSTPLRSQFPSLQKVNSAFSRWLKEFPCVFSNKRRDKEFSYYLEGSIQNYDAPVYAFETGMTALQEGRYFVGQGDSEARIDILCRTLRLRGVECATTEQPAAADD